LVAGGWLTGGEKGIPLAYRFDPTDESWTRVSDMNKPRFYPTLTHFGTKDFANSEIVAKSGKDDMGNDIPNVELYNPTNNVWTDILGAGKELPYYPGAHVISSGQWAGEIFYSVPYSIPDRLAWRFDPQGLGSPNPYWNSVGSARPTNRWRASPTLLPLLP